MRRHGKSPPVHPAQGTYRLDAATSEWLKADLMHLIVRPRDVVGRYGRRGHVAGAIEGNVLSGVMSDCERRGSFQIRFDETYGSFDGWVRFSNENTDKLLISGHRAIPKGRRVAD